MADYEALCPLGSERITEALISRYTGRMDKLRLARDQELSFILEAVLPTFPLDIVLRGSGWNPAQHPQVYWGPWPNRLAWGVESCLTAIRLLFCGQVLGAAVVARTQLERWTFLRASVARLKQQPDEDTVDYIARVWSSNDQFDEQVLNMDSQEELPPSVRTTVHDDDGQSHDHIHLSDGTEICPAMLWSALSEMMHGRYLQDAVAWDSVELLDGSGWTEEYWLAVATVREAIRLCFRQLSLTAADLAEKRGDLAGAAMLLAQMDSYSEPHSHVGRDALEQSWKAQWRRMNGVGPDVKVPVEALPRPSTMVDPVRSPSAILSTGLTAPPQQAMLPLTPNEGLSHGPVETVRERSGLYTRVLNGEYPAGRRYRDDELASLCFVWHRSRYINGAFAAMRAEQEMLGEDFNVQGLTSRWTTAMIVTEAASMAARWFPRTEMRASAFLVGGGLRSAWWLWLEDDDRAMSVLRVVLEQCARLRTWRLKPEKAGRLEERGDLTTPRDWLEAAGWKRLTALNRALGEFAHAMPRSDWSGARDLLSEFQTDVEPAQAIYTARRAALTLVTEIAADEIVESVRLESAEVASAFASEFSKVGVDLPLDAEAQFDHIWTHRATRRRGARQFASAPGVPAPGSAFVRPESRVKMRPASVADLGIAGLMKNPRG